MKPAILMLRSQRFQLKQAGRSNRVDHRFQWNQAARLAKRRVGHISTRQYARIVGSWVQTIGLNRASYGTHSMRRTKPTLIYRRTKNLRAVQLLLGHTKLESTVRYLGIEVDDALEMAEQTEV